jgi:hypothetical protein
MATHPDQPGWRPDPGKPGHVRWWNGLGWSDSWRSAGEAVQRERDAVQAAARGSTISPQQVARSATDRRTQRGAPTAGAATRSNLLAGIAPLVGLLGLVAGAYGLLSLAGVVISIIGLALTRRIEGRDARSGRSAAVLGLLFSLLGLLRWLPVLLALVPGVDDGVNS